MNTRAEFPFVGACLLAAAVALVGCSKVPEAPAVRAESGAASAADANVADGDVTTNVKTALLRAPGLESATIDVITLKGDVRLVGVLDRQVQIDDALKVARATEGVHSLHDELTLKQ